MPDRKGMFGYHDTRFRDIVILLAGAMGFMIFFWGSGKFWLPAGADLSAGKEFYAQRSDTLIRSFGYRPPELPVKHSVTGLGIPADSLVQRHGTEKVRKELMTGDQAPIPFITNRIRHHTADLRMQTMMQIDVNERGELVQFEVDPQLVQTQTPFNSRLMSMALQQGLSSTVSKQTVDTLVAGLIDYQHNRETSINYQNMRLVFQRLATQEDASVLGSYLSEESVWKAVDYYLKQSFWSGISVTRDSLVYDEEYNYKVARTYLTAEQEVLGIQPSLQVDILPAGSLLRLKVNYPEYSNGESPLKTKMEKILLFLTFLFSVWVLVVFYLRIKARALDTGPALVVSFVAGFIASAYFGLVQFGGIDIRLFIAEQGITNVLFVIGMVGAISAVVFFLLTSVSDSITRQFWPVKLHTWDLIRQGMFNNKPVGWSIVRGITLGGVLAGAQVVLLHILPGAYFSSSVDLISRNVLLAPLAQILLSLLLSLLLTVPVFMILMNQIRSRFRKIWFIPVLAGIVFMFLSPLTSDIVSYGNAVIVSGVIGLLLGIFYVYFDFLTLILAQFTFLNMVLSKEGWLIQGSPDELMFVAAALITTGLFLSGFLFILRGNESDEVPMYVPEYLEEQAQREKVKQELEIARTVQLTFLPEQTPHVDGFEISAVCIPAHDTGGDYYDVIRLDENRTAVAIGDVSGKGIKAAFYMTFIKGIIHSLSGMLKSPKNLIEKTNILFRQNAPKGTFISMIYGVLDKNAGSFIHVRAGHNPILLKKADGTLRWLKPRGVAVGMAEETGFNSGTEEYSISLEPGDIMVLYTDGITEAQNEDGVFFDERRLRNLLKRQQKISARELRDLIIKDVRTFMGAATQYDDMTLVVVKYTN